MKLNQLIAVMLLFANPLLCKSKKKHLKKSSVQESGSINKLPPLKLTPLHIPDPSLYQEKNSEVAQQTESAYNPTQNNAPAVNNASYIKPPQWILDSSINNAPELLKGIFCYLQSRQYAINKSHIPINIPSFHRFILVGSPGTGKTTLAQAIAHKLNYAILFIPATSLLGKFRNNTAINIAQVLTNYASDKTPKVIIIDELHKLFEHHTDDHSDDSQSAAAFWLTLDRIEKYNPNVIVIGTANNVEKLPPEIKSRFSGKIITIPSLNKNQKIQTFKDNITYDQSITIDNSMSDEFITTILHQTHDCSLRNIQLIIDTAKMFSFAEQPINNKQFPIVLSRTHFEKALKQLQAESKILEVSTSEKIYESIKKWGTVLSFTVNILIFIKESTELLNKAHILKNNPNNHNRYSTG